jgi:hypothetical protein
MTLILGEGRNNFIIEWNENREEEVEAATTTTEI